MPPIIVAFVVVLWKIKRIVSIFHDTVYSSRRMIRGWTDLRLSKWYRSSRRKDRWWRGGYSSARQESKDPRHRILVAEDIDKKRKFWKNKKAREQIIGSIIMEGKTGGSIVN